MSQYKNKKKQFLSTSSPSSSPSLESLSNPNALHISPALIPLRNSAPSLLATAVLDLFPDVILSGGGPTDTGFYYDFIFSQPLHDESLHLIETRVKSLAKEDPEIRSISMMRENAQQLFLHHEQPILAEIAEFRTENILPLLQIGSCFDLSSAPHITSTLELKNMKLLSLSEETKEENLSSPITVIRITGTVFQDPITLKTFCKAFESRKKRDPLTLGIDLNLFSYSEKEIYWHPKGETFRQILLAPFYSENKKNRILPVSTPISNDSILSEHIKLYQQIRNQVIQSPLRLSEIRTQLADPVVTQDLFDSSYYLSDQTTIFCKQSQILQELISSLQLIEQSLIILGLEHHRYVSPFGQGKWLVQALKELNLPYFLEGEGNKKPLACIEWRCVDVLGREWKGPSITLQGLGSAVFTIGRSLFDSIDRTVGLLIEKHEGQIPFHLAPEQIRVVSVGVAELTYAETIVNECCANGFRAEWDSREDQLGTKIHSAEKERIPYIIIIGEKERGQNRISVRHFEQKHKNQFVTLNEFLSDLKHLKGCEST